MADVIEQLIARLVALEAEVARLKALELPRAISSDTYNDTVAKILGSDADGGARLDHLELGNVTGAVEGQLTAANTVTGARFASYIGTFTLSAATFNLVAPGNGIYLLCCSPDDNNYRLIEWVRVRSSTVSSMGVVSSANLSLASSGGTIQITSTGGSQLATWCLIRLAN
jgi:hypothetical protein